MMMRHEFDFLRDADGGAGGGGTPAGGGTSAGGAAPVWYEGKVSPETLGLWQNKGWDVSDPVKLATAVTQSYAEAQKFVGAPTNELIRMPKPGDEAGIKAMWQRLGAPVDAAGYDFTGVKVSEDDATNTAFHERMRSTAAALNLPKDVATSLAAALAKQQTDQAAEVAATGTAALEAAKAELRKNWGANFDANKFVAARAAQALGVDAETMNALESQIGYNKVMEMFRSIGTKIGEDKFVVGPGGGGDKVMTRDQAVAQKQTLMQDQAWVKSYLDGDAAKGREMTALNTLIVGDDTDYSRGF